MSEGVVTLSDRISYLSNQERCSIIILGRNTQRRFMMQVLWAIAWIIIGVVVTLEAKRLGGEEDIRMILLVFMSFWAYYLYRIVMAIRWHQVGKEMLMMKGDFLIHKNAYGQIGRSRQYALSNLQEMQRMPKNESWTMMLEDSFWGKGKASAQIAVDGRTLDVGLRLSDEETRQLIRVFNQELKKRRSA